MKRGKRFLAYTLAFTLCLGAFFHIPTKAADVCFTAIDESVLKLTSENMPVWSGGVLYAPYTTFDESDNGMANWNIQVSYSKSSNKVTVFDTRRFLEFDLKTGTCWDDLSGIAYSGGAIVRGGRPYLPVAIVCEHFDLTYSYREIDQGYLMRIKTDKAVITDARFPEAAENVLNHRLKEFNQSQGGTSSVTTPGNTQQPVQNEQPKNEQSTDTYLAFRCEDWEHLGEIVLIMDGLKEKGMFFLTAELIEERSDLVLRMLGKGHSIGIMADAESMEETRALLESASRALSEQVFVRTTVVLAAPEFRAELEENGWICWNSTLDLMPGDGNGANYFSRRVLNQLGNRTRDTYLSLDVSANTVRILPTLLVKLDDEGFELELPLETRL